MLPVPETRLAISAYWLWNSDPDSHDESELKKIAVTDESRGNTAEETMDLLTVAKCQVVHASSSTDNWTDRLHAKRSSQDAFNQIRHWYDLCCAVESPNPIPSIDNVPTWLLEVQIPSSGDQVRVWRNTGTMKPYAALSYIWGGKQPWKLTSANVDHYENGIQFRDLPRTFQDAASVTRILGLHCL